MGRGKAPEPTEPRNGAEEGKGYGGTGREMEEGKCSPYEVKIGHGITIILSIPIKILYTPKAKC